MDRMDLNLHGMDRSLVRRAKTRAASLGLTLKAWLISLIEAALGPDTTSEGDPPIDTHAIVEAGPSRVSSTEDGSLTGTAKKEDQ